ncbi:MAG: hypothetical protein MUD11_16100 [Rhodobacteraceae bacterium]|nr:hypothetical protein [Paracoccaceae bacterium]
MADPNLVDFYGRVARIEKDHARGYGFEARGTLGRSAYLRPRKKSPFRFVLPAMAVLACGVTVKGFIHQQIGGSVYDQRVAALMDGEGFDRLGGYLMKADVMTLWVSDKLDTTIGTDI